MSKPNRPASFPTQPDQLMMTPKAKFLNFQKYSTTFSVLLNLYLKRISCKHDMREKYTEQQNKTCSIKKTI